MPSKVKAWVRVPTTPSTVARTSTEAPPPSSTWQTRDVPAVHAAVRHRLPPRPEVGVRSTLRKSTPLTVTTPPLEVTAFSAEVKLTTGAAEGCKGWRGQGPWRDSKRT